MAIEWLFPVLETIKKLLETSEALKGGEVMQKNLEFLRDQVEAQGKQQAQHDEAQAKSTKRIAELEDELAKKWVRYGGALFHVLPNGKLDFAMYCPRCRVSTDPYSAFACRTEGCKWRSGIHISALRGAMERAAVELGLPLADPLFDPEAIAQQSKPSGRRILSQGLFKRNAGGS